MSATIPSAKPGMNIPPFAVPRGIQIVRFESDTWFVGIVTDYPKEVVIERASLLMVDLTEFEKEHNGFGVPSLAMLLRWAALSGNFGLDPIAKNSGKRPPVTVRLDPASVKIRIDCDPKAWEGKL